MIGTVKIIADENIPFVKEAFQSIGKVELVAGRRITSAIVKDADILLVRSVTKVNEHLLAGSGVKMVATATIGTDHIDQDYLNRAGINFANAAGSNANSVAEYVTLGLLTLASRNQFQLAGKTIGIIGVGNVGSRVADKCRVLGMRVLKNDPPLKETSNSDEYIELDELLKQSEIITIHVPLTVSGAWPTFHLVDDNFLKRLNPHTCLFNTSRGAVADTTSLINAIKNRQLSGVLLDVWENEPAISPVLLSLVDIATPHIAGYSFDGKVKGTEMIYDAACKFLGERPTWNPKLLMPAPAVPMIQIENENKNDQEVLLETLRKVYDIEEDDRHLRELISLPADEQAKYFDHLRKTYPIRREFYNTRIDFAPGITQTLKDKFTGLGFSAR